MAAGRIGWAAVPGTGADEEAAELREHRPVTAGCTWPLRRLVCSVLLGVALGAAAGRWRSSSGGEAEPNAHQKRRLPTRVASSGPDLTLVASIVGISEESHQEPRYAVCLVNPVKALTFLDNAARSIRAATAGCRAQDRRHCPASRRRTALAMAWAAAYASKLLRACGGAPASPPEGLARRCFENVTALVGSTGGLAYEARLVQDACGRGDVQGLPNPGPTHRVGGKTPRGLVAVRQAEKFLSKHVNELEAWVAELEAKLRIPRVADDCFLDRELALGELEIVRKHTCPGQHRRCTMATSTALEAAGRAALLLARLAGGCPGAGRGPPGRARGGSRRAALQAACVALVVDFASGISTLPPLLQGVLANCGQLEALAV